MRFADPANSNQHIFIMKSLLGQLKNRRIKLGLDTPELVAKGLHSEILLIPQEQLPAVKTILAGETADASASRAEREKRLSDDPWRGTPEDGE